MRNRTLKSLGVTGLLLSTTALVGAQAALPGAGWFTTAGIQNIDTTAGNVTLTAYTQASSTTSTVTVSSLAAGAAFTFFPGHGDAANGVYDVSPTLPAGFSGSMVVSADKQVAAIAQIANNQPYTDVGVVGGYASAQYLGSPANGATLIYPTIKNNFGNKTTLFSVQAASSGVTYNATIKDSSGGTHTKSGSIPANKSVLLGGSDFTPPLASGAYGSVTVVATGGNIAGAVTEFVTGQSPATLLQSTAMFDASAAGATIYCPVFKYDFTQAQMRRTGITVQNTAASGNATVTAEYTVAAGGNVAAGTKFNATLTIAAGASDTFTPFTAATIGGLPQFSQSSVKLTATGGTIVANANEQNFGTTPVKATTYSCFKDTAATAKIAFPQYKKNFGNDLKGTRATTGLTIQNLGAAAVTVTGAFKCGVTTVNIPLSVPANGGNTYFNPAEISDGSLCGVTVTAPAGSKIVGIAQEFDRRFEPVEQKPRHQELRRHQPSVTWGQVSYARTS